MLQLEIPQRELFNEETQEFVNLKAVSYTHLDVYKRQALKQVAKL